MSVKFGGVGFPADKGASMKWTDLIGMSKRLFGKNFYLNYLLIRPLPLLRWANKDYALTSHSVFNVVIKLLHNHMALAKKKLSLK
jgi:hypothetical protein